MKIQKRISMLFLTAMLILTMSVTSYAHEVPDSSKTGSIAVTMLYEGKPVAGGTLTLYRVGEISEDDGNYSFVLTGDFTESGASLEDISSTTLASDLAAYVSDNSLAGTKVAISSNGTVTIPGLELGLYLVVQTQASRGYKAVSPFLVSVPMLEDGSYLYDVDATPKLEALTKTPPRTPSSETPSTENPSTPVTTTTVSTAILPQTGQLNWPVPALAVSGLCLFLAGWALRLGKRESLYER